METSSCSAKGRSGQQLKRFGNDGENGEGEGDGEEGKDRWSMMKQSGKVGRR